VKASAPPRRGQVWWVDLGEPRGSAPAYRRPVVIVSSDRFNRSRIRTVIISAITSNVALGSAPGNVALPAGAAGLDRDSVVNISQLLTIDKGALDGHVGEVPSAALRQIDDGLRLALAV